MADNKTESSPSMDPEVEDIGADDVSLEAGASALASVDPEPNVEEIGADDLSSLEPGASAIANVKQVMLDRVAKSDAFFKQQQRGDPDLTYEEKVQIAENFLDNKRSVFLTRYGEFLESEDLEYFTDLSDDYIIGFQLNEIRQRLTKFSNKTIVRNRRYEAMKELMDKGEYFGDEELKHRDPLMYEQMVGQYLDSDEIDAQVDKGDMRLSTILMKNMDMTENNVLYKAQTELEASQMQESDGEDEKDNDLESDESEIESEDDEEETKEQIPPREKEMLREEFLRIMQLRFLNGEDVDFDYSKVDKNAEYDSLDIRERDEQEKYFDSEETETVQMDVDSNDSDPCPSHYPGTKLQEAKT